jgi:hypothetical protein
MCTNMRERAHSGVRSASGRMVNLTCALAVQHLRWYGLSRSQSIPTYCASRSSAKLLSRKWFCVYGPPPPTVNQFGRGMDMLDLASACLWRLRNCFTPSIWGLLPHFWIKHTLVFRLDLRNGLVQWDGRKYIQYQSKVWTHLLHSHPPTFQCFSLFLQFFL